MKRKILAFALSAAMVMGMTLTAAASSVPASNVTVTSGDSGYISNEFNVAVDVNLPIVEVTVPSTAPQLVINPFKLSYNDETGAPQTNQIVTVPQTITSASNVPIEVNVVDIKAEKANSSDIVLASSEPAATVKTKSVFLYIEAKQNTAAFAEKYNRGASQYVITNRATTKNNLITLAAGNLTTSVAQYKIGGAVVASPASSTPWNDGDTVTISYKFSFRPVLPAAAG